MADCECGCGRQANGEFLPGHDQKLRAELERRVGGLLAVRSVLLAAEGHVSGELTLEELGRQIRRAMWLARPRE